MKQNFLKIIFLILIFFLSNKLFSQTQVQEIALWNDAIPNEIVSEQYKEIIGNGNTDNWNISKVSKPTLSVFVPEKPNGTSIVICPGGGYAYLAINKEGFKVAKWLNTLGITAFVLKYRLPSDEIMKDKTIGSLQDAQESIRYVRRNALKWNLNPAKIGIMGFSAGGHLASTLSTRYDEKLYQFTDSISARPDFSILVYPVISMEDKKTHLGSRKNLLGMTPSSELIEKYSNEKQVNATTPPTFIVHAVDDKSVVIENSIDYFLALKKNNIPSELHFYQNGKHGFGLGNKDTTSLNWSKHCEEWFRVNAFLVSNENSKK